jgi:glycosyltransferase involved in cell wall biosynthesis
VSGCTTSVIIPVLNGEAFIREAVASVLSQLTDNDEVVIVDDGSTDRTRSLLRGYDRRVSILNGPGRGPSAARNVALQSVAGDLVAFLDHDDLWPPGRHQALLRGLLVDDSVDATAGRIRIKIEAGGSTEPYLALDGRHAPAIIMSCLYRRRLIDKVGPFEEDMQYGEDLSYFLRLTEVGMKLVHCDHDALIYRRHASNATNTGPTAKSVLLSIAARKLARARRSARQVISDDTGTQSGGT